MSLIVVLVGLALLCLPAVGRWWSGRLAPEEWARVSGFCLVAGSAAVEGGLVLVGLPTVARQAGVPAVAEACQRMLGDMMPGGTLVGLTASVFGGLLALRSGAGLWRARRAAKTMRAEPYLGEHYDRGWYELVVVPSRRVFAASIASGWPQVLLTTETVRLLDEEELQTVIRHEEAHLAANHPRVLARLSGLEAALGWLGPVRASIAALRLAMERVADEHAAGPTSGGRQAVQRALLRVAREIAEAPPGAAFASAASLLARVDALDQPAPQRSLPRRLTAWAPSAGLLGVAGGALMGWADNAHMVLSMAGLCRL